MLRFAEMDAVTHRMAALEEMFRQSQQVKGIGTETTMPLLQRLENMETKPQP